ncbi:hypothetical protein [Gordonia sp. NB41Y]|uniref:hypothetical protein n=1 Tax=Gordonia sp. NB41Y TaxID=875808 RepID=UPI0009E7D5F0|nr:hypothetical protein [Gordonia sp. NB41Y]WLP90013.1 hypothetical protein Q9K23_21170 [Gordonia sp. NB41Y]
MAAAPNTPSTGMPQTRRPRPGRLGVGIVGLAVATGVAFGGGFAHAAPTAPASPAAPATPSTPATPSSPESLLEQIQLGAVPLDSQLAEAVRSLKAAGADQMLIQAAQLVQGSIGQISPDQITGLLGQLGLGSGTTVSAATAAHPVAETDPLALLKLAGIQTFTPSVAPFCTTPTDDNPLGIVTAGAGAVAGPWPLQQDPTTPLNDLLGMIGLKPVAPLNIVDDGETGYAFVPASATTGGKMQVAWFNVNTFQGGAVDLEPLPGTENAALTRIFPALGAIRLAPVKTGNGTILSAVYGTAQNGDRTCYFLPAIGVVDAQ